MAEHFKLVITPKGTQIVTFTGVDEDFAQKYGDTLAYAKMLAGNDGKHDEPIFTVSDPKPGTMEYAFSQPYNEPIPPEIAEKFKNKKSKHPKSKAKDFSEPDPDNIDGRYTLYNYKKRIKERAANFRSYAFINFVKKSTQFVTLTFDNKIVPNANDLDIAHEHFRKFIKRIQSKFTDFRYLATFSRQKNGNWHYHMLCNFDDSVTSTEINYIWKYGVSHSLWLTSGDDLYTKISYCIDNMFKVSYSDLKGEKGYLHSHKLQNHVVLRSWNDKQSEKAYELLREILQTSTDKPTPRNSVMLEKGESFFTRLGSSDGTPYEVNIDDVQINYLYSTKGFPELFDKPVVARRK